LLFLPIMDKMLARLEKEGESMKKKDVMLIACGKQKNLGPCTTCGEGAQKKCGFALYGKKQGQTCDRLVCERCSNRTKLCVAHQRRLL
jgi:hypothetical protein